MPDLRFHSRGKSLSLAEILRISDGSPAHSPVTEDVLVQDVALLHTATRADIVFFTNPKLASDLSSSRAGVVLIQDKYLALVPEGIVPIVCRDPKLAFAKVAAVLYPPQMSSGEISSHAYVSPSAEVGKNVEIGAGACIEEGARLGDGVIVAANAVVGKNVVVGDNTFIGYGVSLSHCLIGCHTRILPGARLGQQGFGFIPTPKGFVDVPQLGRVIVGDFVEIGANSCIDRGTNGDTCIGDHTRLDNLVQIGHNAQVGKFCILVAHCSLGGSVVMEDGCLMSGHSSIKDHVRLAAGTQIGPMCGVIRDTKPQDRLMGAPAMDAKKYWRRQVILEKLTTGTNKKE